MSNWLVKSLKEHWQKIPQVTWDRRQSQVTCKAAWHKIGDRKWAQVKCLAQGTSGLSACTRRTSPGLLGCTDRWVGYPPARTPTQPPEYSLAVTQSPKSPYHTTDIGVMSNAHMNTLLLQVQYKYIETTVQWGCERQTQLREKQKIIQTHNNHHLQNTWHNLDEQRRLDVMDSIPINTLVNSLWHSNVI